MSTKTCSKCGVEKDVGEFYKRKNRKEGKDGLRCWCKLCVSTQSKEYRKLNSELISNRRTELEYREKKSVYNKEYQEANREEILVKKKEYQEANREEILAKAKEYREANREKILAKKKEHYQANREEIIAKNKEYYQANREELNAKKRTPDARENQNTRRRTPEYRAKRNKRIIEDSRYRMECILRVRVRQALKAQGAKKFTSTMDLIGCSPEFLTKYLEKQINPGTKREDYHVDHIEPCALFDLTKEEEQKMCFHWTNLQLLLGPANQAKSDDVIWSGQVYKPDEVPPEIREAIYAHCRSNMTLRSS